MKYQGIDRHVQDITGKAYEGLTIKDLMVKALCAAYKGEEHLEGPEKLKRGVLAQKIYTSDTEVELTAEEVALIKQLIGKGFVVEIVLFMSNYLEGK